MSVTTATLWVCSCGYVDRVDNGPSATSGVLSVCSQARPTGIPRHNPKPVLVVVPIP